MGHQFLYNEFTEQDCKSEGTFSSVKNDSNSGRYTMNKKKRLFICDCCYSVFPYWCDLGIGEEL